MSAILALVVLRIDLLERGLCIAMQLQREQTEGARDTKCYMGKINLEQYLSTSHNK